MTCCQGRHMQKSLAVSTDTCGFHDSTATLDVSDMKDTFISPSDGSRTMNNRACAPHQLRQ